MGVQVACGPEASGWTPLTYKLFVFRKPRIKKGGGVTGGVEPTPSTTSSDSPSGALALSPDETSASMEVSLDSKAGDSKGDSSVDIIKIIKSESASDVAGEAIAGPSSALPTGAMTKEEPVFGAGCTESGMADSISSIIFKFIVDVFILKF